MSPDPEGGDITKVIVLVRFVNFLVISFILTTSVVNKTTCHESLNSALKIGDITSANQVEISCGASLGSG